MLIGKGQTITDVGKAMIFFIGGKILGEIKRQRLQAKKITKGISVFTTIKPTKDGLLRTSVLIQIEQGLRKP